MYCIVSLPRAASTYCVYLVHAARYFQEPQTYLAVEPFNPRYNTVEDINRKYTYLTAMSPLPVMKIISSHDIELAKRVLTERKFKTIFIEPKNLRNQILKALIGKVTDRYFGDRREEREPHVNKCSFQQEKIDERIVEYAQHMELKKFCDYHYNDEFITSQPKKFIEELGAIYVKPKYTHVPPFYDDYMMLQDVDDFIKKYENSCNKILGRVL